MELRIRPSLVAGLLRQRTVGRPPQVQRCITTTSGSIPTDNSSKTTGSSSSSKGGRGGPRAAPLGRPSPWPAGIRGKNAIVTGGSRGIGLAVARRLALQGVTCTLVGRDEATLKRAVEALPRPPPMQAVTGRGPVPQVVQLVLPAEDGEQQPTTTAAAVAAAAPGGDSSTAANANAAAAAAAAHTYVVGDVRDTSLWGALFARSPDGGQPDIHFLVNAAGVSHSSVLAGMPLQDVRQVLDVNLYGTIAGCRAAMLSWLRRRSTDRCIINVSSLLAVRGGYGATAYAASKAGVIGLTRALAEEGAGRRIRANVIVPGYIETDMIANIPEDRLADIKKRIPMGRLGMPEEVADATLFLLKNAYANNCVLNLDGGLSAAT